MRLVTRPASRMIRRWWEKVDLLSSSPASCLTWAHHDSPWRARKRMVASRCGSAGAVMVPQVLALITATFPARERSRALAWFGVTMGLAFVAGQILGGLLLQADVFG